MSAHDPLTCEVCHAEGTTAEVQALLDEIGRLREAFADLYEEALDMRSYVPDYFAEKWKHDEALERAKSALAVNPA